AIGRFLRMFVMGMSKNVVWTDLQDALPVLYMCRDLYTARLHRQLKLEEQLYVELINLLRSPETLLARTGEFIHYWCGKEKRKTQVFRDRSGLSQHSVFPVLLSCRPKDDTTTSEEEEEEDEEDGSEDDEEASSRDDDDDR